MQIQTLKALIKAFLKFKQMDSLPITCEDGLILHSSEIMCMKLIRHRPGDGVTAVASKLGISKAAVSQTVTKLVKKGMITKEKIDHDRVVHLELTDKGNRFLDEYLKRYSSRYNEMMACFDQISDQELEVFKQVFEDVEKVLDKHIAEWETEH